MPKFRRPGNPHAEPLPGRTVHAGPLVLYIERANGDYRDVCIALQPEGESYPVRLGYGSASYKVLQALTNGGDGRAYREFIAGSTHHVMASISGRLRLLASTLDTMPREDIANQIRREGDLLAEGCKTLRTFLGVRA